MKRLKKVLALVLACSMVMLVAGGCGNSENSTGNTPSVETDGASNLESTASGEAAEGGKLSYWIKMDPSRIAPTTDNYANIMAFQEMEKNTGIEVEFIHPPSGQEDEKFSLMLTSGVYPDMIYYDWGNNAPGGPQKMIDDGIILRLNEIIEEYAPNLHAFLKEYPEVKKMMMTDEGSIYCFPNIYPYYREDATIQSIRGNQLRGDWLEELGLDLPVTIDDWYTVLTAFKEKGTTEDGQTIIPMVSRNMSTRSSIVRVFANAWNGLDYDFYVEGGQVKYGPCEEDFREYVETIAKWYAEGLIDPEFPTFNDKEHDARITSGAAGAWHSGLGAGMGIYIAALGDDDSKVAGARFAVANEGDTPYFNNASNSPFLGIGTAITTACEDPVLAAKWLDYHYSEEGDMLLNWGVEGVSYEIGEDGLPYFTDIVYNDPDGLSLDVAIGKYAQVSQLEAYFQDQRVYEARMWLWPSQQEASSLWDDTDFSKRWPLAASLTTEEGSRLSSIMNDIDTYRDEMVLKFIIGAESMDNYDRFVEQINSMGIDGAIEIRQQALDRYYERMA